MPETKTTTIKRLGKAIKELDKIIEEKGLK